MLLRGVKFGPPALDNGDIQGVKNRAQNSGRSFGGAPLRNGGDRGGRINFASDRPNPFAAHLDPSFVPPPNLAAPMMPSGWMPPGPGSAGFSRGPPPPPRGGMSGYRPPYPPAGMPQRYPPMGYHGGPPPGQQGQYPPPQYNQRGNHRGGGYGGYGRY